MSNVRRLMKVTKRNNKHEELDIEKINKVLSWAVNGLKDVSITDIVANAKLNWYDTISTKEIQSILINSAVNLFNEDRPNYQLVASRLLNLQIRKEVWRAVEPPTLQEITIWNVDRELYEPGLLEWYSDDEFEELNSYIKHDRDFLNYSGIKQLCDKYLVQNRKTKELYETPQFAYMLVAMTGFHSYEGKERLKIVKDAYDMFSKHIINLPTPQLAGMRTRSKQFASCALFDVDDTLDSIRSTVSVIMKATSDRYGLGINMSKVRSINSEIREGETVSTGVIPFLKTFEAATKSCQQAGLRGGSATVNFPIFHPEIMDILPLKNENGTEDNRVRKLDYVIHTSKTFYSRLMKNQKMTLFNYNEVPDAYNSFGLDSFDSIYEKSEKRKDIKVKKEIDAADIYSLLVKERAETGRIYLMNIDHVNDHGAFLDRVDSTNLCVEVTHPTHPIQYENDPEGMVGVCILAAINLLGIRNDAEFEKACYIAVRFLEEIIDYQEYPILAMENFAKKRRSLGIGLTNVACYFAKNGYTYSDPETPNFMDSIAERLQFYCLKASMELAKERGPCEMYDRTKYSQGIFSFHTYKKEVDEIVTRQPTMPWPWLMGEVATHGLRHSTQTAQMPCESSSVVIGGTNGVEAARRLMTFKGSKLNILPVLLPEHKRWHYQLAFDIPNEYYINVIAAYQKWIDMSISANLQYRHSAENKVSDMDILKHIIYAYKRGIKTLYYHNTDDDSSTQESSSSGCESGACAI